MTGTMLQGLNLEISQLEIAQGWRTYTIGLSLEGQLNDLTNGLTEPTRWGMDEKYTPSSPVSQNVHQEAVLVR